MSRIIIAVVFYAVMTFPRQLVEINCRDANGTPCEPSSDRALSLWRSAYFMARVWSVVFSVAALAAIGAR